MFVAATFYRRPLPEPLPALDSPEGRTLFAEALSGGHLESYFPLAEQFQTQAEPSFCGLTSLVVVLNSLAVDPGRLWKGPWRWFGEEMLDCCVPLDEVRVRGLTLDEFACLARCNGAISTVRRPTDPDGSVDALRAAIAASASDKAAPRVVVGYTRTALGQSGDGHFSPLAGYHPGRDLALVLDVARFKYPPHWVPLETLHRATLAIDPATGRSRGWVLLSAAARPTALGLTMRCDELSISTIAELISQARHAVASAAPADLFHAASTYLNAIAPLASAIVERPYRDEMSTEQANALRTELSESTAADLAARALSAERERKPSTPASVATPEPSCHAPAAAPAPSATILPAYDPVIGALLLLLAPPSVLEAAPAVSAAWAALRQSLSPVLREELATLDAQLAYVAGEAAAAPSC
jgi:glutathione gamma-glutamylcysteinyltransferase